MRVGVILKDKPLIDFEVEGGMDDFILNGGAKWVLFKSVDETLYCFNMDHVIGYMVMK